jgi:hypothetical protein
MPKIILNKLPIPSAPPLTIPKNSWEFTNGAFEILGTEIINNNIFDTSSTHNPNVHEEYKKITTEYNIIHNI